MKRSTELSPKARHLYRRASYFKRKAAALKKVKSSFKSKYKALTERTDSEMLDDAVSSMDRVRTRFFHSQLENVSKRNKGRRYTLDDKVLALALMKQCGSGYNLLSKIFTLPSRKTLTNLLNRIPVKPGICEGIFNILKAESKTFKDAKDKCCILLFDEMYLKPCLSWNYSTGSVDGFEDFGYKRTQQIADHCQVS